MTDVARTKATVYVGGLDNAVNQKVLTEAFLPFGEIVDVSLPKPEAPSSTDPHRGFGYVEFEVPGDAKEAIDNMDQSELYGRVIKVATAKPQKKSHEGLGSKIAVWEQEGWITEHAVDQGVNDQIQSHNSTTTESDDPMQGLDRADVAGPQDK